jgi:hypothetical protein
VLDTEELDANADELARLRAELVGGITAAGFQASVRAKPAFGTNQ